MNMLSLFFLGIVLVILSIILINVSKNNVLKKIFIGSTIVGFAMFAFGFQAFAPVEKNNDDIATSQEENSRDDETEASSESSSSDNIDETEYNEPDLVSSEGSFNSDYDIESFLSEHTSYSDIQVSGTYVADPYGAVITVNVPESKDQQQVVSKILTAFYENAGDKLNNFDSLSIIVDNGDRRLKTEFAISSVMNPKVYRASQVQSLAQRWTYVPSKQE